MNINSKTTKKELIDYIGSLEYQVKELCADKVTLMDEIGELQDRTFDLTCYLEYVKAAQPELWKNMRKVFGGLKGFVSTKASKKKATEAGK